MWSLTLLLASASPWTEALETQLVRETAERCMNAKLGSMLKQAEEPYAVSLTDNRTRDPLVDSGLLSGKLADEIERILAKKRVRKGQKYRVLSRLERELSDGTEKYRLTLALFEGEDGPLALCSNGVIVSKIQASDLHPPSDLAFKKWVFRLEASESPGSLGWGCASDPKEAAHRARIGAWMGINSVAAKLVRSVLSKCTADDRAALERSLATSETQTTATWIEGGRHCARANFALETLLEKVSERPSMSGKSEVIREAFKHLIDNLEPISAEGLPVWTNVKPTEPTGVGIADGLQEPDKLQQSADARAIEAIIQRGMDPKNAEIIARWYDPNSGKMYSLASAPGQKPKGSEVLKDL